MSLGIGIGIGHHLRHGGGGGGGGFTPANVGMNLWYNAIYNGQAAMVDIMHGSTVKVSGGASDGQPYPDANRDSLGNPTTKPTGATGFQLIFNPPAAAVQYKLSWTLVGATDPTFTVGAGLTGLSAVSNHSVTFTPTAIAAGTLPNNYLIVTLPGDGSYITNITCRPVSDPGGFLTAQFKTQIAAVMPSGAPLRTMQYQNIEGNGGQGSAYSGSTLKYPVDGDNQLKEPILTAANRNRLASPDWYGGEGNHGGHHDGFPAEACVNLWTETGASGWWCCPWNYASTYIAGDGTNSGVGSVLAAFCAATGKSIYAEMSNEIWNTGTYDAAKQCNNEANYRGQTGQTWSDASCLPACRVVATSNITLSGTQTIDGVSVVAGDRVLVAGQSNKAQNGPYVVAAGAWSRAADTVVSACKWFITAGTTNANTTRFANTSGTITLGTTLLTISQFNGYERYAEKSAEMWDRLASAFTTAGVSTAKIIKTISWQQASTPTATTHRIFDYLALIGKPADAYAVAPYVDAARGTGGVGTAYTGAVSGALAALDTDIDDKISSMTAHKAYADSLGIPLMCYEFGDASSWDNATFGATYYGDSGLKDRTHRYLNELRRVMGQTFTGCYFHFCGTPNPGTGMTGQQFEVLWRITDTIDSTRPRAQALNALKSASYMMFDPGYSTGPAVDTSPSGTAAITFSGKNLLPEATYSLADASGHFALSPGFSSAGGSIVTNGTGIPDATYNFTFNQTYNGTTKSTAISFTMGPPVTTTAFDATFNPSNYTLSTDKLTATRSAGASNQTIYADTSKTSGYFEMKFTTLGGAGVNIGISDSSAKVAAGTWMGSGAKSLIYNQNGAIYNSGGIVATVVSYGANDLIGVLYDGTNVKFYRNNVLQATLTASTYGIVNAVPGVTSTTVGDVVVANFGATAFTYPQSGSPHW